MKIGILTFHSQLNYGGVLQCWALKTALEKLGHEVVVIDRWMDKENSCLMGEIYRWRALSLKAKVKAIVRTLFGCGDLGCLIRTIRTRQFIKKLNLTKYHFVDWMDAPRQLGVDALVVGSDQVWHPDCYGGPWVYLLQDAPHVLAISYAASISKPFLQDEVKKSYREGLKKFAAISCRERAGCNLIAALGFEAHKVVDPTLLLSRSEWERGLDLKVGRGRRRRLVCYFMSIDYRDCHEALEAFAKNENCDVVILGKHDNLALQPLACQLRKMARRDNGNWVKILYSAGPKQFVNEIATATWMVTDSFHGVMFSTIFGVNFRFVRPADGFRASMFDRIDGFVREAVRGPVYVNSVIEAVSSFSQDEKILYDGDGIISVIKDSESWLRGALNIVKVSL